MDHDLAPVLLSEDDLQLSRRILDLLRADEYAAVQESVIYFESKAERLALDSLANLRDILNHLYLAARVDASQEERDRNFHDISEHLRHAVTHPYQDAIDRRMGRLKPDTWVYTIRRQLAGDDVIAPRELKQRRSEIFTDLAEVRAIKGQRRSSETAKRMQTILDKVLLLEEEATPSGKSFIVKLAFWVVTILVAAILGAIGALIVAGIV